MVKHFLFFSTVFFSILKSVANNVSIVLLEHVV